MVACRLFCSFSVLCGTHCVNMPPYIQLAIDGHLGRCKSGAFRNSGAMNSPVCVCVCEHKYTSVLGLYRGKTAEFQGLNVFSFRRYEHSCPECCVNFFSH